MLIPPRDRKIIESVARYDTLTRAQITDLHFPGDDGRITRKRLRILVGLGFLNVTNMRVVNPAVNGGVTAPVYYPSAQGCAFLAQELDDDAFSLVNTTAPSWMFLYHFVAVAATRVMFDRAAETRSDIRVVESLSERALRSRTETEPHKRYRLFTLVTQEPKLICKPDGAFLLEKAGVRKIFYLEQDRDTTKSAERVAAQKCGGFAGLLAAGLHKQHFPTATEESFRVLMIAPTSKRRDALRKAVSEKPGGRFWRFASLPDLSPLTLLSGNVWYRGVGDQPEPMVPAGGAS